MLGFGDDKLSMKEKKKKKEKTDKTRSLQGPLSGCPKVFDHIP